MGAGYFKVFPGTNNAILDRPIIVVDGFEPDDSQPGGTRRADEIYNEFLNEGPYFLASTLRGMGFDVIVYDNEWGADYIQRNAFAFVEMIQHINSLKVGEEPLVIIGPSMGGLISRYALELIRD